MIINDPDRAVSKNEISSPSTWTAERGDSLRKVLTSWSKRSRVEVEWLAEYDYPLQASVNFVGTYEAAVRALLVGFEEAHPQPVAQLHTNPSMGQRVLVVRARGNSNKD
jgi:type IV pili sensor histidine kinase/response regulator